MNRSYPALRGIAILLVILNHTIHMTTQYANELAPSAPNSFISIILTILLALGVFAVPIFLFLSGCFFAYAAGRDDLRANYKIVLVNLKHVAIPYLVWSIIFYAAIFFIHGTQFSIFGYIKNLLVGYPFNFVPLLIFYYLLSPLLVRLFRRSGAWFLGLIGLYQVILLVLLNSNSLGLALPGFLRLAIPPVLGVPLAEWAIYFPLGLYTVLQAGRLQAIIPRLSWLLAGLTVAFFGLGILDVFNVVSAPLMRHFCPLPFVLLCTTFQRSQFPMVRTLELLGKRAYGLYLTNLLVLDLSLFAIGAAVPGLLVYPIALMPVMFAIALLLPVFVMISLERRIKPVVFRYAFG